MARGVHRRERRRPGRTFAEASTEKMSRLRGVSGLSVVQAERSQREQLEPPTYPPSPKYCAAARACTSLRPPPPRMTKIVFKLFPVLRNAPNRGRHNGALKGRPIVQTAARFRGCATIGVISYARITRAVIAKRITEIAKRGERDRLKLSEHRIRSVIANQKVSLR